MSLKTVKIEKVTKEKRYFTNFGILKKFNIFLDFILIFFNFFALNYLFFGVLKLFKKIEESENFNGFLVNFFKKLFFDFSTINNNFILQIQFYILIFTIFIFILFSIYIFFIKNYAKKLNLLSSAGLEKYKFKYLKNGILFKIKKGEELKLEDFKDNKLQNIIHIFNLQKDVVVKRVKNNSIFIKNVNFKSKNLELKDLKKGFIYLGIGLKNDDIYIKLTDLTHYLIVGQSGAGKSVLQNVLIASFLKNLDNLYLFLVDLKGGVEFYQYFRFKNVEVVTSVNNLFNLTTRLIQIMEKRYKFMLEKGIKNWNGKPVVVMIDEYASIADQADLLEKDERKKLHNNLKTLLAKSRAAGIKFFIATQKATADAIDTTLRENLQTKILMRTVSRDAQRVVVGGKEILEELGVEPANFKKGRFIFYSDAVLDLVQSPFCKDDFYKNFENEDNLKNKKAYFEKKDNEVEESKKFEIIEQKDNKLDLFIAKRKELYKKATKLRNKEIQKKLRLIKKRQEEEKETCKEILEELADNLSNAKSV